MDDSAEDSPLYPFKWMLPALDGVAEKAGLSYVLCCGSENGPKSIYGKGFLVTRQKSFSEELAKKDEELLYKTQGLNLLKNRSRKFENESLESEIKWLKAQKELEERNADLAAEIAKVQSFSEEMGKKDVKLLRETEAVNSLSELSRKFKNLSMDTDAKLHKVKHDLEKRDADLAAETVKVQTLSKEIEKKDKELQEKTLTINQLRIHEELVKVLKA